MFISKISLQNWKNFKKVEAHLSERVFLIGPNASGKSNFLDAFRFLQELANVGLAQAIDARGGISPIRCLAARESSSIAIEVILSENNRDKSWFYRIEFNQDSQRRPIVKQEKVMELQCGEILLDRPEQADADDSLRLTQTALEQIVANKTFRPIADFLETIMYQHLVPQVVRDPKGFSPAPVSNDPYGRDLLLRIHSTDGKVRDARLKRIGRALRQAVPQLQSLEIEMDTKGTPHLIGRYEHWRPYGAKQNESQFSDGTLRLFGLMWAMFDGTGPLLMEEPELSLHPEVVRSLPQMLVYLQKEIQRMKRKKDYPRRQVIISTHSEELLSDHGIAPNEVLRIEPTAEGSCLLPPDDNDKEMMKNGLSVADVILPKSNPHGGQILFDFKQK